MKYNSQLSNGKDFGSLESNFSKTHPGLICLLKDLLEFNPYLRATASECLKHKIFDHIRIPDLERPAPFKIKINNDLSHMYDYEECETKGVNEAEMINYFKTEILKEIEALKAHSPINQ
jgi:serine/threonine protein kinase